MKRIAIVDDSTEYLESIKNILLKVSEENEWKIDVGTYEKPRNLIYELEEDRYFDIYLLDIEMSEMTGIELAKRIRKYSESSYIIFITSYIEFALEGYEVSAFRYILKEDMREKLPKVLSVILEREQVDNPEDYYHIINNTRCEKFRYKDIIKIFKEDKNTVFETKNGTFKERNAIGRVLDILPEGKFVKVDQGVIVNLESIRRVHGKEIYLENNSCIIASRSNISKIKEQVSRYWGMNA